MGSSQRVSKTARTCQYESRMRQEAPGGLRRPQEPPGDPRRLQEAPGGFRRPQEASDGPRRPHKAPGGPAEVSGGPQRHQEAPGDLRRPQEASGGLRRPQARGPRRPKDWRAKGVPRTREGAQLLEQMCAAGESDISLFRSGGGRRVSFLPHILRRGRQDVHVERKNVDFVLFVFR